MTANREQWRSWFHILSDQNNRKLCVCTIRLCTVFAAVAFVSLPVPASPLPMHLAFSFLLLQRVNLGERQQSAAIRLLFKSERGRWWWWRYSWNELIQFYLISECIGLGFKNICINSQILIKNNGERNSCTGFLVKMNRMILGRKFFRWMISKFVTDWSRSGLNNGPGFTFSGLQKLLK